MNFPPVVLKDDLGGSGSHNILKLHKKYGKLAHTSIQMFRINMVLVQET